MSSRSTAWFASSRRRPGTTSWWTSCSACTSTTCPRPSDTYKGSGGDLRFLRIVYRAHVVGGELRHETDGTTDEARWVPLDEVADLDRVDLVDIGIGMLGA